MPPISLPLLSKTEHRRQLRKPGSPLVTSLEDTQLNRLRGSPLLERGSIASVPVETLLEIFQLITPPSPARESLYRLLLLTHVCRFWRAVLTNQPHMWSTIFITQKDRRSFIEMCLERSYPAPLDITMEAFEMVRPYPGCMCSTGFNRIFLSPNERTPCEGHFQFDTLVEVQHSNRIHRLAINFDESEVCELEKKRAVLGRSRFFASSFPRLATLRLKSKIRENAVGLFLTPPFPPSLRSLAYTGTWNHIITPVNNLTSFSFEGALTLGLISVEDVRLFMLNNRSLESLRFVQVDFAGDPEGPPVHLHNLKTLTLSMACKRLSSVIRAPLLSRLSSLQIFLLRLGFTLYATGDGIEFSVLSFRCECARVWEDFVGYASPTIRYVSLDCGETAGNWDSHNHNSIVSMLSGAPILEIGKGCLKFLRDGWLLEGLKRLGPQLKVIRFVIGQDWELLERSDEDTEDTDRLPDQIEELVKYRFEHGRPFSEVERVVGEASVGPSVEEDLAWKRFYYGRNLGQYIQPV
jgi:hypothetical protein